LDFKIENDNEDNGKEGGSNRVLIARRGKNFH